MVSFVDKNIKTDIDSFANVKFRMNSENMELFRQFKVFTPVEGSEYKIHVDASIEPYAQFYSNKNLHSLGMLSMVRSPLQ